MARESKAEAAARLALAAHTRFGMSVDDVMALVRAERALSRWSAQECGDGNDYASWAIERDEATGKPFRVTYPHHGPTRREAIPDREAGAKRRVEKILAGYPGLVAVYQGDPRGAAFRVVKLADIPEGTDAANWGGLGMAFCLD